MYCYVKCLDFSRIMCIRIPRLFLCMHMYNVNLFLLFGIAYKYKIVFWPPTPLKNPDTTIKYIFYIMNMYHVKSRTFKFLCSTIFRNI